MLNWLACQEQTANILLSGIYHLHHTHFQSGGWSSDAGNYLVSYEGQSAYIGEAKNLNHRLKQQTTAKTSTFYKTYLAHRSTVLPAGLDIGEFAIQTLAHKFGRKEMEEFGIVNLPTCLNKFQKNKQQKYSGLADPGLWVEAQTAVGTLLAEGEAFVLDQSAVLWFKATAPNRPGLYYVENSDENVIYIGESSNLKERYNTHSDKTYFSALRRHIGTELLGFTLIEIKGKKRYFTQSQDQEITRLLRSCKVRMIPVNLGRFELETYLIQKHHPILNRKDNDQ